MESNTEEKEYVMVECIQIFRMRYAIKPPKNVNKSEWALDTVTMEEAKEFSQKSLGETIVSHRYMTEKGILELCDHDNDYAKTWPNEQKLRIFTTILKENVKVDD